MDEQSLIDETLRFLAGQPWRTSDSTFLQELTCHLGRTLDVAYALCGILSRDDLETVQTVALYNHGKLVPNMTYSQKGSTCEQVLGESVCVYQSGIQDHFPDDHLLIEMGAESYIGTPLWTSAGEPLGILALVDKKPIGNGGLAKRLLQIAAMRAGSELEREQVMSALEVSQKRFADFAELSSDWFWETDEHLRFSYFSKHYENVTGMPPSELLGRTRAEVGAPGSDPEALEQLLRDMDAHRPFKNFEHLRVKPNGETVYVAISGSPSFDGDGKFLGYRGVGRDITEQKLAEQELIASRDEAANASVVKSQFLATMSHEFRTPLNAILGMSEVIAKEVFGPAGHRKYREYGEDINASGTYMLSLINDILDISSIEAGKRELTPEPVDIRTLIVGCVRNQSQLAESKGIELTYRIEDGVETVFADERSLVQIVYNLISNATKFTEAGGKVTVFVTASNGWHIIQVRDTGIGIPADHIDKITEPFERMHDNPHLAQEGTGLGLSIVSALVKENGGKLDITSEVDAGTTVSIALPDRAQRRVA